MKLTIEQCKQIYKKRCHESSCKERNRKYHTDLSVVQYMCRLSEMYGFEVFTKEKNTRFSKGFKQKSIDRVIKRRINYGCIIGSMFMQSKQRAAMGKRI